MGLETKAGDMGVVTTSLETVVNWGRTNAMWPLLFGLACCAIEMMGAQGANYDLSRFGMEINRASPRQADLIIVAGRVSRKMAPVISIEPNFTMFRLQLVRSASVKSTRISPYNP